MGMHLCVALYFSVKMDLIKFFFQGQNCVVQIPLPGKVFSMSVSGGMLAVATSHRQILAYNTQG